MGYQAKILLDSINVHGNRLTTMEVTFPRFVLAEFNTHRMLSRNSASSRAIPAEKMIQRVEEDPFIPEYWGKNQKGMQAHEELDESSTEFAKMHWVGAIYNALESARNLSRIGTHKQTVNRILEPFMWHTVIVSATEWSNFFALRCHPDAQPEIRKIAEMMRDLYENNRPGFIRYGEWHVPLCPDIEELRKDFSDAEIVKISAGRCARVSYLTHHGERDPWADIELCTRLIEAGHMSPMEHVARPISPLQSKGNFVGWEQYRKIIPNESDFGTKRSTVDLNHRTR